MPESADHMFEFELTPLENVAPWGELPNLSLHWFGLTDGRYRMKVGDDYLLNYSPEFVARTRTAAEEGAPSSWVEYQVVRLWEDVMEMLPAVLEPVPVEIRYLMEATPQYREEWSEELLDNYPDRVWETGVFWLDHRRLDCNYLTNAPEVWIWSTETDVIVSWDNGTKSVDGVPVWSAGRGSYHISRDAFVEAVREFDRKLIEQMGERVQEVVEHWDSTEIQIDLYQLQKEHADRSTWLASHLRHTRQTPWEEVIPIAKLHGVGKLEAS